MSKRRVCGGKRCFRSAGAARRSASERGMVPCRVYRCPRCKLHHVTSSKALHGDADQGRRELDDAELWQQEQLQERRAQRKVDQAIADGDSQPELTPDPDTLDDHDGPGSTASADDVHGIAARDRILAEVEANSPRNRGTRLLRQARKAESE